ncbi:NAD(P)-binding protein [Phanerochaete sordida]|uniref:NAD(P)-binding protein n=1 Tax=Phanerochaete sordida TaxID=48140 RepID=A0A9P3GBL4_9APHY|nr:NAD(P)-binding protein [Phanerochaete sordida]
MSPPRVWLVTGSSSGFGLAMCKHALARGDKVVATLRTPSALDALAAQHSEQLLIAQVDVTRADEVAAAFRAAKARFGRVDVVFNNAAASVVGEIEGVPDADARHVFEVDFWGAAAVSKEAVRFFREENPAGTGGVLLNVSSQWGHISFPCSAYYSAAKHALEAFTEALAYEVDPKWNVKICLITPGAFRTDIRNKATAAPVHPAYADVDLVKRARHALDTIWDEAKSTRIGDVNKAVAKIYEASALEKLPMRIVLGDACIERIRKEHTRVAADLDASEKWSEGLQEDE